MSAEFTQGRNIAMKVPGHEYDETAAFYRDVLGLRQVVEPASSSTESARCDFGEKALSLSQAEIWLEVCTSDVDGVPPISESTGAYVAMKSKTCQMASRGSGCPVPRTLFIW
jgi:hypothetical protein